MCRFFVFFCFVFYIVAEKPLGGSFTVCMYVWMYVGVCSMKWLGLFLLPPWSTPFAGTHLYSWVERDTVWVKCLAQEHSTMSPTRAEIQTARFGDERTNHEVTVPPTDAHVVIIRTELVCRRPVFGFKKSKYISWLTMNIASFVTPRVPMNFSRLWNLLHMIQHRMWSSLLN